MIVLGLILLIIGLVASISILTTIGAILLVVGLDPEPGADRGNPTPGVLVPGRQHAGHAAREGPDLRGSGPSPTSGRTRLLSWRTATSSRSCGRWSGCPPSPTTTSRRSTRPRSSEFARRPGRGVPAAARAPRRCTGSCDHSLLFHWQGLGRRRPARADGAHRRRADRRVRALAAPALRRRDPRRRDLGARHPRRQGLAGRHLRRRRAPAGAGLRAGPRRLAVLRCARGGLRPRRQEPRSRSSGRAA